MKKERSNAKILFKTLIGKLESVYDKNESLAIAKIYFNDQLGISNTEIIAEKEVLYVLEAFQNDVQRLINQEPIQYIVNKAMFLDTPFIVNQNTLIPRPETEELVLMVTNDLSKTQNVLLLDIGTGSGCISVLLKKLNPKWHISALDFSMKALEIAKINAKNSNTEIDFFHYDILNIDPSFQLTVNCIVSNPPYILSDEKKFMHKNVLNYEPHSALFVPDNDALLFYNAVLIFSKTHLASNGCIYFEINPLKSNEMLLLLAKHNFTAIECIKDFNNKIRFVKGIKP